MVKTFKASMAFILVIFHVLFAELRQNIAVLPAENGAKGHAPAYGASSYQRDLPTPPTFLPGGGQNLSGRAVTPYRYDSVTVLVYRINFTDKKLSYTASDLEKVHDTANQMYREWSGNKFRAIFKIHSLVFEAPNTAAYYYANWSQYVTFCKEKINGTGVNFDDPGPTTRLMTVAPEVGFNSSAAPPWVSMLGLMYRPWTIVHELGHALALLHGNGLEVGTQVVGTENYSKENMEYGDVYCNMGIGYEEDINTIYKSYFGWYETGDVKPITATGTYKIYTHDQAVRAGKPIALTIPSGNDKYTYWLEYRTDDTRTRECVLVHLAGYMNNKPGHPRYDSRFWDTVSYLLDMTPNSLDSNIWWGEDMFDAGLATGKTFADPFGGFSVKVMGVNQGVWNENGWAEVEITVHNTFVVAPDKKQAHYKYYPEGYYLPEQLNNITVYNLSGQRVTDFKTVNKKASAGIYIIKVPVKEYNVNKKVMLAR